MTLRGKYNALLSLGICVFSLGLASKASAIPAFARKYGMACTACHESWPKLNSQGWAFRDNGYQWLAGKDNPMTANPNWWPIALRDTIGYQYSNTSNIPQTINNPDGTTTTLATTSSHGQIGLTNIDLLFAGTLTKDISFLITLEPFLTNSGFTTEYPNASAAVIAPGQPGYVESAWVRFDNILGTPFLNFKIGKGSLDLAFDEHRSFFIFNNSYAIYHYQPVVLVNGAVQNSNDPFGLGNNQWQASIEGHNIGSSFRYAVSLVETQNSPGTSNIVSSAGGYAHIQQLLFPSSHGVAELRGGLFGSVTSYPTMAQYSDGTGNGPVGIGTNPGAPVVPYTGYNSGLAYRAGIDLSAWFVSLATPLNLRVAVVYGNEDSKFFPGVVNVQNAEWLGQLIELDWTPMINFTTALRWDGVQNLQSADPTASNILGQTETQALVFRYTFEIMPRTAQTLHFEFGHNTTWGVGANGLNQQTWNAFGGMDFAF